MQPNDKNREKAELECFFSAGIQKCIALNKNKNPLHLYVQQMNHISVLENEIAGFCPPGMKQFFDFTFGLGGHSKSLLQKFPDSFCIGVDRDSSMYESAMQKMETELKPRIRFLPENFADAVRILAEEGKKADYIVMDLGLNSAQLDVAERGFSFSKNGPLDMRMNQKFGVTAEEIVNGHDEQRLRKIFFDWGEERHSAKIAKKIVLQRKEQRIVDTFMLKTLIEKLIPPYKRQRKIHCATRIFQALRIAVNEEISSLKIALDYLPKLMNPGGRVAVIAFHSLEDRPVKMRFKFWATECICPSEIPICRCEHKKIGTILTKKPIRPGEGELRLNRRSGSAKLRIFEFDS